MYLKFKVESFKGFLSISNNQSSVYGQWVTETGDKSKWTMDKVKQTLTTHGHKV